MTNASGRTCNQCHVPRSYAQGKRRFSVYWTWSYPWEENWDTTELDNRFSTMTEVRRVGWPKFEADHWHRPYRNVSAAGFVARVAPLRPDDPEVVDFHLGSAQTALRVSHKTYPNAIRSIVFRQERKKYRKGPSS